jgi:hypothetical protein
MSNTIFVDGGETTKPSNNRADKLSAKDVSDGVAHYCTGIIGNSLMQDNWRGGLLEVISAVYTSVVKRGGRMVGAETWVIGIGNNAGVINM